MRGTLRHGFGAGARIAAAPVLSDAPIILLCVLVLRSLPDHALAALSLCGALFVAWMARDALLADPAGADTRGTDLRRAVAVNALSPHPWLFWATVGGPVLVAAGNDAVRLAVAFVAGFYVTLVGAKVAVAALVETGRRRGTARLVPRVVAERVGALGVVRRFGATSVVSALLLGVAAAALLADAVTRLRA